MEEKVTIDLKDYLRMKSVYDSPRLNDSADKAEIRSLKQKLENCDIRINLEQEKFQSELLSLETYYKALVKVLTQEGTRLNEALKSKEKDIESLGCSLKHSREKENYFIKKWEQEFLTAHNLLTEYESLMEDSIFNFMKQRKLWRKNDSSN